MSSDIIVGVDGTGPSSDDTYAKDFKDSFVQKLCRNTPGFRVHDYHRGPTTHGLETVGKARHAYDFAKGTYTIFSKLHAEKPKLFPKPPRIFLTGYSRGGAAVIEAAYKLKEAKIPVHGMMLFDAVDRSIVDDRVNTIPDNVKYCFHAVRADSAESREIFGNCGRKAAGKVFYLERSFHCTHGAMGGCPWKEAGEDGYIEEVGAGFKTKAATFAAGGVLGLYALHKIDKTKVKMKQELEGRDAVWAWMHKLFLVAKANYK
ncbi:hypothetical protein EU803_09950 [Loktanella sp. IMCC34160]|uniref:hypothetical protein n=1 Tax=Loktanella sp. IMCC34160 TaxID=2510646 RepID=UPI00101BD2CB|nr:hypothetical protein [Loktanella sp. IMCC34160]RYG91406.1 hypothetical protein EU803_09950 [Loktanella sp. IMCC34160]